MLGRKVVHPVVLYLYTFLKEIMIIILEELSTRGTVNFM